MGWFLFILAPVLRSWSCALVAFGYAEPSRTPWQVLTENKAGGLLGSWKQMACVSSHGFISKVIKGQQEKTLHQETEKSPMRVQFQGSTVWGCGEQCKS